jgi:enamine deaminase RidA (YjgF/YER057c/UK114 family)
MSIIDERLRGLDIALPDVMPPVVDGYVPAFAPFVRFGNQIQLSGRLGKKDGKPLCGKVGEEISLEEGKVAARGVAIELLAVLKAAVGDLDNVRRVVKLFVMVNGAPNFTEPHRVADGASELLVQVFGERGIHARSAVSVAQVPFGACVEIDMIAELREHRIADVYSPLLGDNPTSYAESLHGSPIRVSGQARIMR